MKAEVYKVAGDPPGYWRIARAGRAVSRPTALAALGLRFPDVPESSWQIVGQAEHTGVRKVGVAA